MAIGLYQNFSLIIIYQNLLIILFYQNWLLVCTPSFYIRSNVIFRNKKISDTPMPLIVIEFFLN